MKEIDRYLDYGWEWKTICKVVNFKHQFDFEIYEIEMIYEKNLAKYGKLKEDRKPGRELKTIG